MEKTRFTQILFRSSLACLGCSKKLGSDTMLVFHGTCIGYLAKACTNKAYQEKEERYNMKNENQCIL
jgi:hypothetical protein